MSQSPNHCTLSTSDDGKLLTLAMARPPVNALIPDLMTELRQAIEKAPEQGHKAIVLTGSDRIFSAGLDVATMLGFDAAGIRHAWTELFALVEAIARSPIPVIAAITGHSPAGGAVLTLFCDYRIMAEGKFNIGLNEVQVGLVLPELLSKALQLLVGYRHGSRLATAGAMITADEAYAIGFVDALAPQSEVLQRAQDYARMLMALPENAMRITRAEARKPLTVLFDDLDKAAIDGFVDMWFAEEAQGVLKALVAKLAKR